MVGEATWKTQEVMTPKKIVKQKQCGDPGETAKMSATTKDLKRAEVVLPTTSPLSLPTWPGHKIWLLKKDSGYCQLTWVMTPIAVGVPDVLSSLE